ncbi:MAG: TSUP family transporter, partial [Actinomycetaceae bacterium]
MEWLTTELWVVLALLSVGVGITKTGMPGLGALLAAVLAAAMPARASTGLLLLVLVVGDVIAVTTYRRSADRKVLLALLVPMLAGLLLGSAFLLVARDAGVRLTIGLIVLAMVSIETVRRLRRRRERDTGTGSSPAPTPTRTSTPVPTSTPTPTTT